MRDPKHASSDSSSISHVPLFRAQSHQPSLDELKLSHILNEETCPPISFSDFAAFVAHQEFTTENLLFVIWYRSYRERYEQMSAEIPLYRFPVLGWSIGIPPSPTSTRP